MKAGYRVFHHIYDDANFLKVYNYHTENKVVFFSYNSYPCLEDCSSNVIGCWSIKYKHLK